MSGKYARKIYQLSICCRTVRSPPAPINKQGCFILPEKWQGEQREQRKLQGATGSDREIFRNEKVFLTEKNPFSRLPLTVFLIILDN